MKRTLRTLIAAVLCVAALLSFAACGESGSPEGVTTAPDAENQVTSAVSETDDDILSPEEKLTAERIAYLATVTYRDFVLTEGGEPYYVGRWFDESLDGIPHKITVTDGAHFYFLIEDADSFDVNFTVITTGTTPYFSYSIDGAAAVRQLITEPTVTLPDSGRHTVRIIADGMEEREGKWNMEKGFALKSITPAEGGSIVGIKPTEPVIFFYGDSITEGIAALSRGNSSNENSATHAYPWLCAEALGATPYFIGYGASGIIQVGSFNTMMKAIDYLSKDRLVDDRMKPDVIVVNHGTNDSGVTNQVFMNVMKPTISRLREKYPDAPIVYMIPFNQSHALSIRKAFKDMEMANTYVVETSTWEITYTDGLHPDAAGAKVAGENLARELKKILGEDFFEGKRESYS